MKKSRGNTAPVLSKRLGMLAEMVTPGNRLVDVGCDHGFLDIYLVQEGICPKALAMDVREGPLAGAKEHIREYGLGNYIEVRLSDGLAQCGMGEADTLVCAGMGGRLMERILREGMAKAAEMKELILQPQSELPEFRRFLRMVGFRIICQDAVFEEEKYYFGMKAVYEGTAFEESGEGKGDISAPGLYDLFGEHLLTKRHPVLLQYLEQRAAYMEKLKAAMTEAGTEKAKKRLEEVHREQEEIKQALSFYEGKAGLI